MSLNICYFEFCVTFEADFTNYNYMVNEQGLSFTMAMVQADHSFVDGLHVGQFVDELQKIFNRLLNFPSRYFQTKPE